MVEILSSSLFSALFGAAFQELLYWHGLKRKLSLKSVKAIYRSIGYWVITLSVIVSSAVGVMIWSHGSTANYEMKDYALMGAAFPALFKMGVSSLAGASEPSLGKSGTAFFDTLKMYFFQSDADF